MILQNIHQKLKNNMIISPNKIPNNKKTPNTCTRKRNLTGWELKQHRLSIYLTTPQTPLQINIYLLINRTELKIHNL